MLKEKLRKAILDEEGDRDDILWNVAQLIPQIIHEWNNSLGESGRDVIIYDFRMESFCKQQGIEYIKPDDNENKT